MAGNRLVSRKFVFIITNHLLKFTFDEIVNSKEGRRNQREREKEKERGRVRTGGRELRSR